MPAISSDELQNVRVAMSCLEQCVHDVETVTSLKYAMQDITVGADEIATAKAHINSQLATLKTTVSALTDIV